MLDFKGESDCEFNVLFTRIYSFSKNVRKGNKFFGFKLIQLNLNSCFRTSLPKIYRQALHSVIAGDRISCECLAEIEVDLIEN